jgi:hypothetical protein
MKKAEVQESENLAHGPAGAAEEFEIGDHQVGDEGDPDLTEDGIGGIAEEALDLEVLLDPFEEQLDLPSTAVDLGDGGRGERLGVGEEDIVLAGLRISTL